MMEKVRNRDMLDKLSAQGVAKLLLSERRLIMRLYCPKRQHCCSRTLLGLPIPDEDCIECLADWLVTEADGEQWERIIREVEP